MDAFFTTFGINGKLLVVQMINFGVLLAALSYFLYKPVMQMLDERRAMVEKGVSDAAEAERKLKMANTESKELVGKAAREAEDIISHARGHALERGATIEREAKERAKRLAHEAVEKAEELKRTAMKESDAAIAKAALLAAEKILSEKRT